MKELEQEIIANWREAIGNLGIDDHVASERRRKAEDLYSEYLMEWSEDFAILNNNIYEVWCAHTPQERGHYKTRNVPFGLSSTEIKRWIPDKVQPPIPAATELVARFDALISAFNDKRKPLKKTATKAREQSLTRIRQAIATIEQLVPLELKRTSMERKRRMEKAHESMILHAGKLDIHVPRLGLLYHPEECLEHARLVAWQVDDLQETVEESASHTIRYAHVYQNGWENGNHEIKTTSDNPSTCARMILIRLGSDVINGVRITAIDGERVDYLIIPEDDREAAAECQFIETGFTERFDQLPWNRPANEQE